MSNVIQVEIKISQLIEDLKNGLSWKVKEDTGKGSIQAKYRMEDEDVDNIQQHPAFAKRVFKIIDDISQNDGVFTPTASKPQVTEVPVVAAPVSSQSETSASSMNGFNDL